MGTNLSLDKLYQILLRMFGVKYIIVVAFILQGVSKFANSERCSSPNMEIKKKSGLPPQRLV
jgi:hypothetical protein